MTIVHPEVSTMLKPRPPSATDMERKRGIQVNSPHQANSVAAFMVAQMSTLRPSAPWNSRPISIRAARCRFQASGSFSRRCSHRVRSPGATPAKKTARHPKCGITTATTAAPNAYPTAQELCTRARALARWRAGQVSATRAAPLAHSPPIPRPSRTRQTISCQAVWVKPHSAVATE